MSSGGSRVRISLEATSINLHIQHVMLDGRACTARVVDLSDNSFAACGA
jgi:hypothetical protein